jgi:CubicO group peptidase (beta-lactamase class C family)
LIPGGGHFATETRAFVMKLKILFSLIFGLIVLLLSTLLRPVWIPGVVGNDRAALAALDQDTRVWLASEMRDRGIPGISMALVINGKLAAVEALGVADYWRRTPLSADTLMEVASNSKVVTALAALKEIRAGRLDLDRPLSDYRPDFTLEGEYADRISVGMLLTHTAGLGNILARPPRANELPGDQFQYSGVGFEVLGKLLAADNESGLPAKLKSEVLTPLGVSDRAGYRQILDPSALASPHVSITIVLLLFVLPLGLVFGFLVMISWLAGRAGLLSASLHELSLWILATSIIVSLTIPFMLLAFDNALRFLLVDLLYLLAILVWIFLVRRWRDRRSMVFALGAAVLLLALVLALVWRIPVPMEQRSARFPAAAGLRASARDMGVLLAALLSPPPAWRQEVEQLTTARVRVNSENSWGLGIGIQEIGAAKMIWHWGVNYPGYQSLMLGSPYSGDGLVVLMNGGPMVITAEGPRYSGLELARELAIRILPGQHGAYWQGIQ